MPGAHGAGTPWVPVGTTRPAPPIPQGAGMPWVHVDPLRGTVAPPGYGDAPPAEGYDLAHLPPGYRPHVDDSAFDGAEFSRVPDIPKPSAASRIATVLAVLVVAAFLASALWFAAQRYGHAPATVAPATAHHTPGPS
jgi:hypothetical protein